MPCPSCQQRHTLPPLIKRAANLAGALNRVFRAVVAGQQVFSLSEMRMRRLMICKGCPFYSNGVCSRCGCVVQLKTALTQEVCPESKW
jgi:hypothetical protein